MPVVGTNSSSYTLAPSDVGTTVTVKVTATNSLGSASATSAGVGPVAGMTPVSFPGTGIIDTFAYTANPLTAPWATLAFLAGGLQANGTQAVATQITAGRWSGSLWTNVAYKTPPIECYVDVPAVMGVTTNSIALYWSNQAAAGQTAYRVDLNNGAGVTGQVNIRRIVAGTSTLLTTANVGLIAAGDSFGMRIDETATITAYLKHAGVWSTLASFQDATPLWNTAATPPLQYIGLGTNDTTVAFDNFGGGQTAFPTTGLIDSFNYAASPLGGPWSNGYGTLAALQANGTVCTATPFGTATAAAGVWTGMEWQQAPVEAFVTAVNVPTSIMLYWANTSTTDANHYHYRIIYSSANAGTVSMFRQAAGATTATWTFTNLGVIAAGDGFGMRIDETGQINAYRQAAGSGTWTRLASAVDPTPLWKLALTTPLRYVGLGTTDQAARLDNFSGGGVGTPIHQPTLVSVPSLITT